MSCEAYPLKEVRSFASSHSTRFTEYLLLFQAYLAAWVAPSVPVHQFSLLAKLLVVTGDTALYLKDGWSPCVFLYDAGKRRQAAFSA